MEGTLSELFQSGYPAAQEGEDLLRMNEETAQYGLSLSRGEALELAQTHRRVLESCGRIETGFDTVQNIVRALGPSQFLNRGNYADALNEAVEAFYTLKNESDDRLSDGEVLSLLADGLERYEGDLGAYLESPQLEGLLRARRSGEKDPPEEDEQEQDGREDDSDE